MRNPGKNPIIAIDRGASFTDFAVVDNRNIIDTKSLENRDWNNIGEIYEKLITRYQTRQVVFTGSVSGMPEDMRDTVTVIPEIEAIGFGSAALAEKSECVVASMGTGTAIVHFNNNTVRHLGGTGVGGGTIKGLGSLLCGTEDPAIIEKLALKGNPSNTNLTISDLGYESVSFLGADMTASNFAAIKSRSNEDLSAGILSLVTETVGIIASICAREAGCMDNLVMVGKVARNQVVRDILSLVGTLYQTTFSVPDNPGFATVYGASVKYEYDLSIS